MSKTRTIVRKLLPAASWSVAPMVWSVNTELGQILPVSECSGALSSWSLTMSSSFALLLAIAMAMTTYRRKVSQAVVSKHERAETSEFIAYGGVVLGILFAFAVLLQGMASLVLSPCQV
jgi:hypothetical protein